MQLIGIIWEYPIINQGIKIQQSKASKRPAKFLQMWKNIGKSWVNIIKYIIEYYIY